MKQSNNSSKNSSLSLLLFTAEIQRRLQILELISAFILSAYCSATMSHGCCCRQTVATAGIAAAARSEFHQPAAAVRHEQPLLLLYISRAAVARLLQPRLFMASAAAIRIGRLRHGCPRFAVSVVSQFVPNYRKKSSPTFSYPTATSSLPISLSSSSPNSPTLYIFHQQALSYLSIKLTIIAPKQQLIPSHFSITTSHYYCYLSSLLQRRCALFSTALPPTWSLRRCCLHARLFLSLGRR